MPGSGPPVTTHPPPSTMTGESDTIDSMNSMRRTESVNPAIIGFVQERDEGLGDGGDSYMDTCTGGSMALTSTAAGNFDNSSFTFGTGSLSIWTAGFYGAAVNQYPPFS